MEGGEAAAQEFKPRRTAPRMGPFHPLQM
jgi:hypothetical protein